MTQKDKDLLLKDLCGRLPYGVIIEGLEHPEIMTIRHLAIISVMTTEPYKPYLRSKTNMTKEERDKYNSYCDNYYDIYFDTIESIDYLNSIHVDYRGLIPKDLAIEVTEENNPYWVY